MDNLNIRLEYAGGKKADDRMALDKLRTLKKALLYSYQAETAVLEDGREFRCVINPDQLKNDYDNKILSIPFYDICLNTEKLDIPTSLAEEPINIKVGDVFYWKETNTYWLVYLQNLEESAYFRAEIRKCSEIISINGKDYRAYIRGPVETTIRWNQKSNITWNDLNYSKIAYIKEDEESSKLKRFDIIKINNKNFQVQVVNKDTASDGILIIYLSEYYNNEIEDIVRQEEEKNKEEVVYEIQGETIVYPYDIKTYTINSIGGSWSTSNSKIKIVKQDESSITIEVITGRQGESELIYTQPNGTEYRLPLTIKSF